jgi:hypothetical protein
VIALHLEVEEDGSGGGSEGPGGRERGEEGGVVSEEEAVEVDLEDGELGRDKEGEGAASDEGGLLGEDVLAELVGLAHGGGG